MRGVVFGTHAYTCSHEPGKVHVEILVHGEAIYVDRVDGTDRGPYRDSHRVGPALSCAGGRLLAARADDESWLSACARADDEDREIATDDARHRWAAADHLAFAPVDPTLPAEVAVPLVDGQGVTVAALAVNIDDPEDSEAVAEVASRLGRAARAAGRTLGHA